MQTTHSIKLPAVRPVQPEMQGDRLPLRLAAPVLLALSVLCWVGVWWLARVIF